MKAIKFNIPIYGGKVRVIYTNNIIKTGKKLGYIFNYDDEYCRGIAYRLRANDYLILIKKKNKDKLSVLAHESLHITNYILKDKGVIVNTKNDEAQAYLLSYIIDKIQYKSKK